MFLMCKEEIFTGFEYLSGVINSFRFFKNQYKIRMSYKNLFLFIVLSCLSVSALAQVSYPEDFDETMPLYDEALGDFERVISSDNEIAQAYFNQGFQMMYAFAKMDGARSFREAWKNDPNCAICYWGEAWAWGSYLNGKMRADESPRAYAAIQKAKELADQGYANEKEKAFIEAMSVRYAKEFDADGQAKLDTAYAEAMKELSLQFEDDLDAGTFYAEALFLLEPRRGTRDVNDPDVIRLHQELERVLAIDIKHPGACHLYIHATESTTRPEKAESCAEFIGTSIPGASHINHMPSHTWNEIGRWGDAVRANIMAWHSDQKAAVGKGFAIYPSHNLHMLLFAGSMDGQSGVATQAGRDYTKLTGNNMYEVLTLVRFGRFDEVLDVAKLQERPSYDVAAGMWDFAMGYASLKEGDTVAARSYLRSLQALGDTSQARFRFHSAELLLGTVSHILEGEIHWAEDDMEMAIKAFEKAAEIEDKLTYDEPEPIPFAARHWLGAALLETEEYGKAEKVYREELEDHPRNGWSLFGLKTALEAQGMADQEVEQKFEQSWSRSDTWIRGSRF
jgi:tetratricopeptide (TPR) repeat protein